MYLIVVGGYLVDTVSTEAAALATAQYWLDCGHDVEIMEQEDNEDSN